MDGKAEELWRELYGVAGTVSSLEGGLRRVLGLGPLIRPLGGREDTLCGDHLYGVSGQYNRKRSRRRKLKVKGKGRKEEDRRRPTHPLLLYFGCSTSCARRQSFALEPRRREHIWACRYCAGGWWACVTSSLRRAAAAGRAVVDHLPRASSTCHAARITLATQ